MWSTWRGPADPAGLSKLCASRAAYPRRFARHCGFTRWRTPPLRADRRRELGCRTPDTTHPRLPLRKTSCRIHSGGRRRNVRRSRHTRRWCERPALCGAEVPCAHVSNRRWGFDGGPVTTLLVSSPTVLRACRRGVFAAHQAAALTITRTLTHGRVGRRRHG